MTSMPAPATAATGSHASITSAPTSATALNTNYISCTHRNQDPDQFITVAHCVCSSSTFLESIVTTKTGAQANSCAYTTLPSSTIEPQASLVTSTDTEYCRVCTTLAVNYAACTSLGDCTPAAQPTPTAPSGCNPKSASNDNTYYFWDFYFRACSMVGFTQVCSLPEFGEGLMNADSWNCKAVGQDTGPNYNVGGMLHHPLGSKAEKPDFFTIDSRSGSCKGHTLTFKHQCDG